LLEHANTLLRPGTTEITDSPEALGEMLALVSSGHIGALDSLITLDQRHIRISIEVLKLSLSERAHLLREVEASLRGLLPANWGFSITGSFPLSYAYSIEFARSQTRIVSASVLVVFASIALYLRSISSAILALIPNGIALLLLFGAMGHWGISQDAGSAIVAPIAIGIAADDTVHFLTAYARERDAGRGPILALHAALLGVGEAVITTALALALGFVSMMTSPFSSIVNVGLLSAVAILGATLADLLVLPALIATVAEWRGFRGLPGRNG
jgi:predicted RND superfamily exporter protein